MPFGLTIKVLKVLKRHQRALFKVQMETHLDQFQMLMILNTPTDKYYGLGGSKRCLGFFSRHQVMSDVTQRHFLQNRACTSAAKVNNKSSARLWALAIFSKDSASDSQKSQTRCLAAMVGLLLDALVFPIVVSKNMWIWKKMESVDISCIDKINGSALVWFQSHPVWPVRCIVKNSTWS